MPQPAMDGQLTSDLLPPTFPGRIRHKDARERKRARLVAVLTERGHRLENPMPFPELARLLGVTVRDVSDLAVECLEDGKMVCTVTKGAYLAETVEELRAARQFKMKRFLGLKRAIEAYDRVIADEAGVIQETLAI